MADDAARLGKTWDERLHNGLASFETRPSGAPQDEGKALMALRKLLILRRLRKRPSRRTHGADPANPVFLAQPLRSSALRMAKLSSATSHTPWRKRRPSTLRARCRSGGRSSGTARRRCLPSLPLLVCGRPENCRNLMRGYAFLMLCKPPVHKDVNAFQCHDSESNLEHHFAVIRC